jgi:hypothetical protein
MFRFRPIPTTPMVAFRYLAPQEVQVVTVRLHPSVLIPCLITGIGGLFAAIAVTPVVGDDEALRFVIWVFAVTLLLQLVRAVFSWLSEYVVITQLRVFRCSRAGITSSYPLKQLDDVRVTRSPAGRLLGFGTLIFDSAHVAIDNIPFPEQVYLEIYGLIHPERPEDDGL